MASEELKKLAEELKNSREETEITLQEISSKTRIDLKFLEAIEKGEFEIMPEVYIRAFIKEYAAQIQLDPEEILKKYDLAKKGKVPEPKKEESSVKKKVDEKKSGEKKEKPVKKEFDDEENEPQKIGRTLQPRKIVFIGGIILVVIILIGSYFLFIKNSSQDIIVERPFEEVLEEKNKKDDEARFEVDEEPQTISQPVLQTDSLSLNISASDTCWVNVTIDGKTDKEFMLFNNSSTSVKAASRFDLIIGNTGGIDLKLNGEELDINGQKGQRRAFSIDKNGIINPANR